MSDNRTWQYEPEAGSAVANICEYEGARCIRFVCEFIDPPSAEDAALMIAGKNEVAALRAELAELRARVAVPDDVAKDALALAYGYLWHVNNMRPGYDAPSGYSRPQLTPEKAAYKARGILRGLLTNEQCGEGINRADAAILATDKEGKKDE